MIFMTGRLANRLTHDPQVRVTLLTGGQDPHYACGLATALDKQGVALNVIGSKEIDRPELHSTPGLRFLALTQTTKGTGMARRIGAVLISYAQVVRYAATAPSVIFHILWNGKLEHFDRTLLMLYYRLLGKKIVLTAHNVNRARRDGRDSLLNRLTLRCQYELANHIFVHTTKMKDELECAFRVNPEKVTVIPFGINNAVPDTSLTGRDARLQLKLGDHDKVVLFFGAIKPYKGLEYLVQAFQKVAAKDPELRLMIAGERKKECEAYLEAVEEAINGDPASNRVIRRIEFIPDDETEVYFKAADVLVLPYTDIFQSGILFLAYAFGLPVIATDVGQFRDDVVEGVTGFICPPTSVDGLAAALEAYFASSLFHDLEQRRRQIRNHALSRHSWDAVARITRIAYSDLLAGRAPDHERAAQRPAPEKDISA